LDRVPWEIGLGTFLGEGIIRGETQKHFLKRGVVGKILGEPF